MNEAPQPPPLSVFISYSVHDGAIVDGINAQLQPHAHTLFWAQNNVPGQDAWATIYSWIDTADMVVVGTNTTTRRSVAQPRCLTRPIDCTELGITD